MTIRIVATIVRVVWVLIEYPYLRRHKAASARNRDKHSAQLWDAANAIEIVGMGVGFTSIGHIQTGAAIIASAGLVLLFAGIVIRWTAILTLGEFFTGTVFIKDDHRLIQQGLYKHVRHPAYTGTLMAHLGLGLCFANWISLSLSVAPFILAALYRMKVEERALTEEFGEMYLRYASNTKRLIPKVY